MNTERLIEFQALAQTLHYGAAASRLYMSQSVLSRHIQGLEKELGVQLFSRTSHKVELTSAGIAFYRMSQDFLKDVHDSAVTARVATLGIRGAVRAGFMLPTMGDKIRGFMRRFDERYPDIFVSGAILTDLNMDTVGEFHFLTLPSAAMQTPDSFELYHRFPERGVLVFPVDYHITPGVMISFRELENETLFLPGYNRSIGAYARIGMTAREATEDHIHIVPVPNPETAVLNVELGRGITVLPRHRASYISQQVRFTDLAEDCSFETLLMHNTEFNTDADRLFAEELVKTLEE